MEMIESYVYRNSTNAFLVALGLVRDRGDVVSPRGFETKELLNQKITIIKPWERCIVLPSRNDDIVAKVAETLWQLAGRSDIDWLKWYLPRAPEFSDDGKTWRGAYGPRLRRWYEDVDEVDQIDSIARKLVEDPDTRQAVISIWEPCVDLLPGKDIPCNNWLHFFIRNNKLYLNVAQRSSDVVWGFSGIDAFSWSVLHEMMAKWVGVEMGDFTYFISSLHVYERHYKKLEKILDDYADRTIYDFDLPTINYTGTLIDLDQDLQQMFDIENSMRKGYFDFTSSPFNSKDLFSVFEQILMLGNYMKVYGETYDPKAVARLINGLPESDFRVAAVEWISRRALDVLPYLRLTELEMQTISNVIPSISTRFS
jgi:thymidylate synthase